MRVFSPYAVMLALAGCSVINSFDEVKPESTAAGGQAGTETGGKGNAGGGGKANGGSSGNDASVGGNTTGGAGAGGATGGKGGGGGGGGAGGGAGGSTDAAPDVFQPGGPKGALVTYNPAATEKKLYVLDPSTGKELSSEAMPLVRVIVNDGAADPDDHWFIIEGPLQVPPVLPNLHVRQLNTTTGAWNEIGLLQSVPPPSTRPTSFGTSANQYLAYLTDSSATPTGRSGELVVVDVTDPTKPALINMPLATRSLPDGIKQGLLGEQASLNVVFVQDASQCASGEGGVAECDVSIVHFLVNSSGVARVSTKVIGKASAAGNVGLVSDPTHSANVIAFPPVTAPQCPSGCTTCPECPTCTQNSRSNGQIQVFGASQMTPLGPAASIPFEMTQFAANGSAFDVCDNISFFTSAVGDVALFAVKLGQSPVTTKLCVNDPGSKMAYDPYTHTLFRGFNSTDMQAYTLDATGASPVLTDKPLPQLKSGFQFAATAVRSPRLCPL